MAVVIVEEAIVVVAMVVVAEKVFVPVKTLLAARVARVLASERSETESPVIVALVTLSVEETVSAPTVVVLVKMPPQALRSPVRDPPVRAK